jgi:LmbE family N-acetylglucosaminyl deacetylase
MTTPAKDLTHLRLLAAFAHPDDEGFGSGGTLAMLVARGAQITLVCGTNGDVGEISDPALATPENLAQVRQQELRNAMSVTGIPDIRFLNYRDSGMAGTADNEHPDSLHQADPSKVVQTLLDVIRETGPHIVITHDPSGGYGHPDHRAMCQHATEAYRLAMANQDTARACLYYVCFPRSSFQRMWQKMVEMDISPPFASQDIDKVGTPDEEVTTVLDISSYVDVKIESLNRHQTQINPDGPFAQLPQEMMREIMGTEYYTLVFPEGATAEKDLLGSLQPILP